MELKQKLARLYSMSRSSAGSAELHDQAKGWFMDLLAAVESLPDAETAPTLTAVEDVTPAKPARKSRAR
jgi:hypothetical protein